MRWRLVVTSSEREAYRTRFTIGESEAFADASKAKGGQGAGFGPHEILEASVACCINIWLRMHADKHGLPLQGVTAEVRLNRSLPGQTVFEYSVELHGQLSAEQRHELLEQIVACPVSQTLLKDISFLDVTAAKNK